MSRVNSLLLDVNPLFLGKGKAMQKSFMKITICLLPLLLITFGTAGAVKKTFKRAKSQFYFGLTIPYTTIGGDFDGQYALVSGSETIIIPEIDNAVGFGITAGITGRVSPFWQYSLEIAYQRTTHEYTFLSASDDATLSNWDFNMKGIYALENIQPYLLLGLAVPIINVNNGSYDGIGYYDANYRGVGINLGAGMDLYVSPRIFLNFNAMYRIQQISSVKGFDDRLEISGGMDSNGMNISAGIMYAIPLD